MIDVTEYGSGTNATVVGTRVVVYKATQFGHELRRVLSHQSLVGLRHFHQVLFLKLTVNLQMETRTYQAIDTEIKWLMLGMATLSYSCMNNPTHHFSYMLYAYSVKRAYRGTKPKESFR